MADIRASSPKMLALVGKNASTPKYDLSILQVGMSLAVPKSEIKLPTLRSFVSKQAKRWNRRFKVVNHGEAELFYEVGRLPDPPISVGTGLSSPENNAPAFSLEAPISQPAGELASWLQPQKKD